MYTNDGKKCVYSKREDWIAGSEEKLIISFFVRYIGVLKDAGMERMEKGRATLRKRQEE